MERARSDFGGAYRFPGVISAVERATAGSAAVDEGCTQKWEVSCPSQWMETHSQRPQRMGQDRKGQGKQTCFG